MAKLRLFANLREIAGTSRVEIDSDTVGGVLDGAVDRFGPDFGRGVESARVWINGETAALDTPVVSADELVLIPPVSGGSQPVAASFAPSDLVGFLPLGIVVLAVLANFQGQAVWGAFLVAVAAIWATDLASVFEKRGRLFAALPVVVTSAGAVLAAYTLGSSGYGLSVAIAVAVALGWAVAFAEYREVDSFSPTLLASLLGGLAAASMVLSRSAFSPDARAVDVFLVAVIAASVLGALALRFQAIPLLDPFTVTALGAVIGATAGAAFWDLDVVGYLLIGLGIAVAMVAGKGLSSMLRLGVVSLTDLPPGAAVSLDSVVLAAAIFYPLIRIVL
jgi:molybdopterin synthase sulfur carrier subunit